MNVKISLIALITTCTAEMWTPLSLNCSTSPSLKHSINLDTWSCPMGVCNRGDPLYSVCSPNDIIFTNTWKIIFGYHRRAVAQSLLGQDEEEATPLRKREQTVNYDGSGYSSTGSQGIRLKRVKLEQYDEEDEDLDNKEREEDNVSALPKARGASRSLRNTKERR